MEETSKRKKVLCPVERDGKTFWKPMGTAFVNKDASINVYLDGLPVNGKLHLRDWDEAPRERRGEPHQFALRAVAGAPGLEAQPAEDLPF